MTFYREPNTLSDPMANVSKWTVAEIHVVQRTSIELCIVPQILSSESTQKLSSKLMRNSTDYSLLSTQQSTFLL